MPGKLIEYLKMNTKVKAIALGVICSATASTASAGIIIDSINVMMTKTTYNARNVSSRFSTENAYDNASSAFNTAFSNNGGCNENVATLNEITYNSNCGNSKRNYGAKYTISGNNSGTTTFQFGMDWGRGGFLALDAAGDESISRFTSEDIWWRRNWNDGDVINFVLSTQGDFTLTLLGFEGCCDGYNSARYSNTPLRSAELLGSVEQIDFDNLEDDDPLQAAALFNRGDNQLRSMPPGSSEFQVLEVNAVPTPGSLPLLGLGAIALWRAGRRRKADAS